MSVSDDSDNEEEEGFGDCLSPPFRRRGSPAFSSQKRTRESSQKTRRDELPGSASLAGVYKYSVC